MKNMYRKFLNKLGTVFTWATSFVGVLALLLIYVFIFKNGFSSINLELITGNYWSESEYLAPVDITDEEFVKPSDIDEKLFSTKYGIALNDEVGSNKEHYVVVTYIDENSPLYNMENTVTNEATKLEVGLDLNKITYEIDEAYYTTGSYKDESASKVISNLENSSSVVDVFAKTKGGGIRGSIIATFLVILLTIVISFPISIATAIYLVEYSKDNYITRFIRLGIDLLSGVPSVIFGLVGLIMFYPLTQALGFTGVTLVLGSLTMVIVLFPVTIKTVEETLRTVPNELRESSLSLGATKAQTILKVILPNTMSGILTALLLSIGRILGESAALIYTVGTVVNDYPKYSEAGTTLSVHIWKEMSGEQPNVQLASAIAIIILAIVFILNIIIKFMSKYYNRKFS